MVLAVTLAGAPVLPAIAMAPSSAAGEAHAAHAAHDGDHAGMPAHSAPAQSPCTQHDACDGQCCAFCAQCFSTMTRLLSPQTHSHPVQTPVMATLHPLLLVGSPDRPPRFSSR